MREMLYFDLFQSSIVGIKYYFHKYEAESRNGRRVEMKVEERTVEDKKSIVIMRVGSLYAVWR